MSGDEQAPSRRAFEVLSEGVRVDILRELTARLKERPTEPAVGFADLRRQVGMRDSGNFSYHLQKLTGQFVLQTDEGYRIGPAGLQVVAALISGVYGAGVELGPVELDDDCPACGERLTATYEEGLLLVECPNGHPFKNAVPPGAVDDRSLAEVVTLLTHKTRHDMEFVLDHTCPFCYAQVEWTADVDTDAPMPETDAQCDRCGVRFEVPVVVALTTHPTVAAFYHDHGVGVRNVPLWTRAFFDAVDVTRGDETALQATVELEGDRLEATLDDSLNVLAVTER